MPMQYYRLTMLTPSKQPAGHFTVKYDGDFTIPEVIGYEKTSTPPIVAGALFMNNIDRVERSNDNIDFEEMEKDNLAEPIAPDMNVDNLSLFNLINQAIQHPELKNQHDLISIDLFVTYAHVLAEKIKKMKNDDTPGFDQVKNEIQVHLANFQMWARQRYTADATDYNDLKEKHAIALMSLLYKSEMHIMHLQGGYTRIAKPVLKAIRETINDVLARTMTEGYRKMRDLVRYGSAAINAYHATSRTHRLYRHLLSFQLQTQDTSLQTIIHRIVDRCANLTHPDEFALATDEKYLPQMQEQHFLNSFLNAQLTRLQNSDCKDNGTKQKVINSIKEAVIETRIQNTKIKSLGFAPGLELTQEMLDLERIKTDRSTAFNKLPTGDQVESAHLILDITQKHLNLLSTELHKTKGDRLNRAVKNDEAAASYTGSTDKPLNANQLTVLLLNQFLLDMLDKYKNYFSSLKDKIDQHEAFLFKREQLLKELESRNQSISELEKTYALESSFQPSATNEPHAFTLSNENQSTRDIRECVRSYAENALEKIEGFIATFDENGIGKRRRTDTTRLGTAHLVHRELIRIFSEGTNNKDASSRIYVSDENALNQLVKLLDLLANTSNLPHLQDSANARIHRATGSRLCKLTTELCHTMIAAFKLLVKEWNLGSTLSESFLTYCNNIKLLADLKQHHPHEQESRAHFQNRFRECGRKRQVNGFHSIFQLADGVFDEPTPAATLSDNKAEARVVESSSASSLVHDDSVNGAIHSETNQSPRSQQSRTGGFKSPVSLTPANDRHNETQDAGMVTTSSSSSPNPSPR